MFAKDHKIFLMIPDSSNLRVLHPGKTLGFEEAMPICAFNESLPLAHGDNVVVFADVRQKFMQQGATVHLIRQAFPTTVLSLVPTGEPTSADSRASYRVSMVMAEQAIRVAGEDDCQLLDVSPEGFGAVTRQEHTIGARVNVVLGEGESRFTEMVRVQTVKPRHDGRFRVGFLVDNKRSPLRKELQRIYAAAQRQQLRRLAGVA